MTTTTYAERVTAPFQAPSGGALLPILDAEIVAINGIAVVAEPARAIPLELPAEPHRCNPWYNPEPWLLAARFLVPLGITWAVIWGAVDLADAVTAHAAGIERMSGYLGITVLGLLAVVALLGGGKRCPGLHCAGCR